MVELSCQHWLLGEAFDKAYQEQELMWLQPPSKKNPKLKPPQHPKHRVLRSLGLPRSLRAVRFAKDGMTTADATNLTARTSMDVMS